MITYTNVHVDSQIHRNFLKGYPANTSLVSDGLAVQPYGPGNWNPTTTIYVGLIDFPEGHHKNVLQNFVDALHTTNTLVSNGVAAQDGRVRPRKWSPITKC